MNKCLKLLPFRSERLWSMWTRSLFITDWNELCTSPIWSNQISLWEFHLQYGAKLEPHHRSTIWRQLCEGRWMSREMLCGEKKKAEANQRQDTIDKKERRKWRLDRFTKGQQFSSLCLGILISWKHNDAASSLYICCLEWFLFCITKLCLLMCWLCTSAFIAGSYYPNWMLLFSQALHNLIKIMSSVASKL